MKKKLMMVAVLLGALTLGACVDDNESASVTKVREAKAKQLEAVAALNNAQAEAELIKANAEKALKEAQAAYKQAQADATAATTDYNKKQYALQLEKIKAEYEMLIASYKAQTTGYEKDIWNNADKFVKSVYDKYTTAIGQVNAINGSLVEQKLRLAQIDIDDIQAKAALETFLYEKNQIIAQNTLEITRLEALKTVDLAGIEKQMSEMAANAYNLIKSDKPAAEKVQKTAEDAFDAAYNPIDIDYGKYLTESHKIAAWNSALLPYLKAWNYLYTLSNDLIINNNYVKFTSTKSEIVEIEQCPYMKNLTMYTLTSKGEFLNATNTYVSYFKDQVSGLEDDLGAPSVADKSDAKGLYIELEAAQAEIKTAQESLDAELKKPVADQDKNNIDGWKSVIEKSGPQRVAYAEDEISAKKKAIEDAKTELKDLQDAIATVQDATAVANYDKAVTAAKEAAETYLIATHEVHKINDAKAIIGINDFESDGTPIEYSLDNGEYRNLLSVYNGAIDIESLILACKENIAEAEAAIKTGGNSGWVTVTEGNYQVFDPYTGNFVTSGYGEVKIYKYTSSMSVEDQKAIVQAEIDKLNSELKVQQTLVEQYKAKLDALLAAE